MKTSFSATLALLAVAAVCAQADLAQGDGERFGLRRLADAPAPEAAPEVVAAAPWTKADEAASVAQGAEEYYRRGDRRDDRRDDRRNYRRNDRRGDRRDYRRGWEESEGEGTALESDALEMDEAERGVREWRRDDRDWRRGGRDWRRNDRDWRRGRRWN